MYLFVYPYLSGTIVISDDCIYLLNLQRFWWLLILVKEEERVDCPMVAFKMYSFFSSFQMPQM